MGPNCLESLIHQLKLMQLFSELHKAWHLKSYGKCDKSDKSFAVFKFGPFWGI